MAEKTYGVPSMLRVSLMHMSGIVIMSSVLNCSTVLLPLWLTRGEVVVHLLVSYSVVTNESGPLLRVVTLTWSSAESMNEPALDSP